MIVESSEEAPSKPPSKDPKVLVIDVGGTHVKVLATGHKVHRQVDSGPKMTAQEMVRQVKEMTKDWQYDVISIGYPGPVVLGKPLKDPHNLGPGWVKFKFEKALGKPVKIINDAAMQALGSYKKGRMLFLGLGTGLGSAMIVDGIVEPMELAHLPYKNGKTYEDYVGIRGLERLGRKKWATHVEKVVEQLSQALEVDDIVLGGGNVKKLKRLPPHCRQGDNQNAFIGGCRMWKMKPERALRAKA
jgi:polyphosphate glucokinase